MKLLSYPDISERFQINVEKSESIDLAVAWITNSKALELLQQQADEGAKIRALVGIDTNFTHPDALERLTQFAQVRVVESEPGRIFHPKMYLFHSQDKIIAWVGSANCTNSGLNGNEELVSEFEFPRGSENEPQAWFEKKWNSIDSEKSEQLMIKYKTNWQKVSTDNLFSHKDSASQKTGKKLKYLDLSLSCDWDTYLQQLGQIDQFLKKSKTLQWDVFGPNGYLDVISTIRYMITHYKTWDNLSEHEVIMLLGLSDKDGNFGLLGDMKRARAAQDVFRNQKKFQIRREILASIRQTIDVKNKNEYIKVVRKAIKKITEHNGVGIGVATRLLALARPDMAVSVNGASAERLTKFSDINGLCGAKYIDKYVNLLEWMHQQPWHNSPEPADPWKKNIWDKRAALVDAFVYKGGYSNQD